MRATQAWVEGLADKSYAVPALFILAAAESIFFPIPADVLLIALCVSKPKTSLRFAAVCTIGSVLGGAVGYSIGYWLWYDIGAGADVFSATARFFFDHVPGFNLDVFRSVQGMYQEYDFVVTHNVPLG